MREATVCALIKGISNAIRLCLKQSSTTLNSNTSKCVCPKSVSRLQIFFKTARNAKLIETEFQAKMALLEREGRGVPRQERQVSAKGEGATLSRRRQAQNKTADVNNKVDIGPPSKPEDASSQAAVSESPSSEIDKSSLTFGEPRRKARQITSALRRHPANA